MALAISAISPSGMVYNWIVGRADLRPSFSGGICSPIPADFGRVHMHAFHPELLMLYDGDSDGDGDGDGGGDSDSHGTG